MRSLITGFVLLAMGCHAAAPSYEHAIAADLSTEDLTELRQVISAALDLRSVRLSRSAFSTSHVLVLENAMANTPQGRIAFGRTITKPEMFHLLSDGSECVLERVSTGQRYPLTLSCLPQNP